MRSLQTCHPPGGLWGAGHSGAAGSGELVWDRPSPARSLLDLCRPCPPELRVLLGRARGRARRWLRSRTFPPAEARHPAGDREGNRVLRNLTRWATAVFSNGDPFTQLWRDGVPSPNQEHWSDPNEAASRVAPHGGLQPLHLDSALPLSPGEHSPCWGSSPIPYAACRPGSPAGKGGLGGAHPGSSTICYREPVRHPGPQSPPEVPTGSPPSRTSGRCQETDL